MSKFLWNSQSVSDVYFFYEFLRNSFYAINGTVVFCGAHYEYGCYRLLFNFFCLLKTLILISSVLKNIIFRCVQVSNVREAVAKSNNKDIEKEFKNIETALRDRDLIEIKVNRHESAVVGTLIKLTI